MSRPALPASRLRGGRASLRRRSRLCAVAVSVSLAAVPLVAAPAAQASAPVASSVTVAAPLSGVSIASLRTLQTSRPTIAGVVRVGNRLTAKPGTWTRGTTFRYVWKVNGTKVGTSKTFVPQAKHRGKKLTLTVTGSKSGFRAVSRTSVAKTVGFGVFSAPAPRISGTVAGGSTLTAVRGTWSPAPTTAKYQWRLNGVAIAGATSSTLKLGASHLGKKISVSVTGSRAGYTTRTVLSSSTAAVRSSRAVPYASATTVRLDAWTVRTGVSTIEPFTDGGRRLVAAPMRACYSGSGSTVPWLDLDVDYVGTDGIVYDDLDYFDEDDRYPSEIWDVDQVYSGACLEFTALALVPGGAVTGGVWQVTDSHDWDTMRTQFFDGVN